MNGHKRDRSENTAPNYWRAVRRRQCCASQTVPGCGEVIVFEPIQRHMSARADDHLPHPVTTASTPMSSDEATIQLCTASGFRAVMEAYLPTRAVVVELRHGNSGRRRSFTFRPFVTLSITLPDTASQLSATVEKETVLGHLTLRGAVSHARGPATCHRQYVTSCDVIKGHNAARHNATPCGQNERDVHEALLDTCATSRCGDSAWMSSMERYDYFFEVVGESRMRCSTFAQLREQSCSAEVWLRQCAPLSAMLAECVTRCVLEEVGIGELANGHSDILYQGHHICSAAGATALASHILLQKSTTPELNSEVVAPITMCVVERT